jgi:hypothetical protein
MPTSELGTSCSRSPALYLSNLLFDAQRSTEGHAPSKIAGTSSPVDKALTLSYDARVFSGHEKHELQHRSPSTILLLIQFAGPGSFKSAPWYISGIMRAA